MLRDPFYRQIIERLGQRLDPELFERAAADLLRTDWPTLVPIRGGTDAGMDGAVADTEGTPFPLISTTNKDDAIGNLTRNLNSYLKDGGERRKVIFATSRPLSQRKRHNLERRASELGFLLVQIYDQDAIAALLYRYPEWCIELLDLSGDPAPLSVIPRTVRPLLSENMIGRDSDIEWLRNTSGDRLLVGQPGSGKTFLLYQLAKNGDGLFVISESRGELAAAIRAQQASTLIVDDAQLYRSLLLDLKQLRQATGSNFSILVSCWPGDVASIRATLELEDSNIHRLELLTRDQMVGVIKGAGLLGPKWLVQDIIEQADGRPGLAVTLARFCLKGDPRRVVLGDRLCESIVESYKPFINYDVGSILAAFSLGGDAGMQMERVASSLELRLIDLREVLAKLAHGGILWEVSNRFLSVHPPALRYALIRDTFFSGPLSLPIEPLLAHVPNLQDLASGLIGARSRGAQNSDLLLREILPHANSDLLWREYASMGQQEADWVLEYYSEKVIQIAPDVLDLIPEKVIPILLDKSVDDDRPLNSNPNHPLRILQDWIHSGYPGTQKALGRRNLLFESAHTWLADGNNQDTGLRALCMALSPEFNSASPKPGSGLTIILHHGVLTHEDFSGLQKLWKRLWVVVSGIDVKDWTPVLKAVEIWAYPGRISRDRSVPASPYMRQCAQEFLNVLIPFIKERPGFLQRAKQIANSLDVDIDAPLDEDFSVLYPQNEREDWRKAEQQQRQAVYDLASRWSQKDPVQIAQLIKWFEQEAQEANIHWPRWTPTVMRDMADQVASPSIWLSAWIESSLPSELIHPFLQRSAELDESDWQDLATTCLHESRLRGAAISVILGLPNSPRNLIDEVLLHLDGFEQLIEVMCLRGEISEERVKALLTHGDPSIARAAASGEWCCDPKGEVRSSLSTDWRRVVVKHSLSEHLLGEILKDDAQLAYDWLVARLSDPPSLAIRLSDDRLSAIEIAVKQLGNEARLQFLERIAEMGSRTLYYFTDLVVLLVDTNLELYRHVLFEECLRPVHLAPLSSSINETWMELACLALDMGYKVEEVAHAVFPGFWSWSGNESDMWGEYVESFEVLLVNPDERIREIGRIGRNTALTRQKGALAEEKHEAVHGMR